MIDKEKIAKLEKKLEQRKLTIFQALQEEICLEWFKTNNPAFLSMLTPEGVSEIINLLIIPGPPNDKIRSYKIPQVAAQLLSILSPKIYELLFQQDHENKGIPLINRLFKYFDGQHNYVISGYVVRIIMNLFPANPSRILEYIYKSQPQRLFNFIESHSIAELITRVIIVEDALLNIQIKERVALLDELIKIYVQNKKSQQELSNINWVLSQAITRLWTQKHKELGRFSSAIFKLIQAIIDNNNLYQQENLVIVIAKQVSSYQKEAPFVIAALYKKIYLEISSARTQKQVSAKQRLTSKRYKYLQSLYFIIAFGSEAIAKNISTSNPFSILLDFVTRFQWHSLALVQIEKIFRAAIHSHSETLFLALSRSYLTQKLKQFGRIYFSQNKKGCGFSGLLINLAQLLKESLELQTGYGGYLKKNGSESDLRQWILEFQSKVQGIELNVRVVHQVAKPFYSISKLPELFSSFFQQTDAINARMQTQSPSKHQVQKREVLQQIENQNELVSKLISQLVAENNPDEKKPEQTLQ